MSILFLKNNNSLKFKGWQEGKQNLVQPDIPSNIKNRMQHAAVCILFGQCHNTSLKTAFWSEKNWDKKMLLQLWLKMEAMMVS